MADVGKFWKLTTVPDGEHEGTWGGHTLRFGLDDGEFKVDTRRGIRGIACPVKFEVIGGRLDEESIEYNF